jgi:hypothetical protein
MLFYRLENGRKMGALRASISQVFVFILTDGQTDIRFYDSPRVLQSKEKKRTPKKNTNEGHRKKAVRVPN